MFSLLMVVLSKVDVSSLLLMFMHRANMWEGKLCVCGDFNVIQTSHERKSRVLGHNHEDFSPFNQFISDNILFDLPLCGRQTLYLEDRQYSLSSMSRLDRFLLSEDWCVLNGLI